jgi:putative transposase
LDHVHLFFGLNPKQSISDIVGIVKANSSKYINEQRLTPSKFEWQKGFGAFSYAKSQMDNVYKYILYRLYKLYSPISANALLYY